MTDTPLKTYRDNSHEYPCTVKLYRGYVEITCEPAEGLPVVTRYLGVYCGSEGAEADKLQFAYTDNQDNVSEFGIVSGAYYNEVNDAYNQAYRDLVQEVERALETKRRYDAATERFHRFIRGVAERWVDDSDPTIPSTN